MKNNKVWTVISAIVLLLQVVAETLAAVMIQRMNVLPDKYLVAFYVVLIFFALVTALLLFLRGKKGISIGRRVVAVILAILVIVGCGVAAHVANQAYQALHTVTNQPQSTNVRNMYVFVRVDDPAQTLADTADYAYAIVADFDTEHTQMAMEKIAEQTGSQLNVAQYEKTSILADKLYAMEADALILNGVSVSLLLEEEGYDDFMEKARILQTIPLSELEVTEPTTEPAPTETQPVDLDITEKPFVVYVSGSDTRSSKLLVSRSDVNILVVVNPVTKQILMINTPRDYYVPNPAGNGKLDKLTHLGLYGTDCSMEALGQLYGLQVDYYAQINFTGFEKMVDAVGGITVYSDQSYKAMSSTYIQKGENTLNGEQALDFARDRYHVTGGDNGRGKNQMKVIKAVIEKMTTSTAVISNYSGIMQSLGGMFKTDFAMDDVSKLVKMQLDDMATWNIQTYAVTGTGGSEKTYSMPGSYAYVMHKNEASVNHAGDLAQRVIDGETLTEEDMKLPQQ